MINQQENIYNNIKFTISKDSKFAGEDCGWVQYIIHGVWNKQYVGYLKFVYIPRENFLNPSFGLQRIIKQFKNNEERIRRFIRYHVDKPEIGFINIEPTLRNKGLSRLFYIEGAKWCQEQGMHLWASTTQTLEAKRAWLSMEKRSLIRHKSGRRFIFVK